MWYMYSDKEGKGVSIGITPARMRDFINEISVIYPVKNKNPLNAPHLKNGNEGSVQQRTNSFRQNNLNNRISNTGFA